LVSVATCGNDNDVLLATAGGKSIRFQVGDVRVFSSRTSTGVRGIRLTGGDAVISMSILHHMALDVEERDSYVRYANARRRAEGDENGDEPCAPEEVNASISETRIAELEAGEEFILSVAQDGLGKRTTAYEYRITNRGGQGITNMELTRGRGKVSRVVGAFPVRATDQVVLVTDAGKLIRCPVNDVRIASRATRGVRLFDVAEDERVVSVARLADEGDEPEATEPETATLETGKPEATAEE